MQLLSVLAVVGMAVAAIHGVHALGTDSHIRFLFLWCKAWL